MTNNKSIQTCQYFLSSTRDCDYNFFVGSVPLIK